MLRCCWIRYVDDIFAKFKSNNKDEISNVLNNFHPQLKFTFEGEKDGKIAFLDTLVKRKDSFISIQIFRKPTHTGRYLNFNSFHHPSHIMSVADSLIRRAILISDPEYLDDELSYISKILQSNNFPIHKIQQKMNKLLNTLNPHSTPEDKPKEDKNEHHVPLPYMGKISHQISTILNYYFDWKSTFIPATKIKNLHRPLKDKRDHCGGGVYELTCKTCQASYIGEAERPFNIRIGEHENHTRLGNANLSKVAQHVWDNKCSHEIDWNVSSFKIIEPRTHIRKWLESILIRESTSKLMNGNNGIKIPEVWLPALPNFPKSRQTNTNAMARSERQPSAEHPTKLVL
jgi:hypothetical protein